MYINKYVKLILLMGITLTFIIFFTSFYRTVALYAR